MDLFVADLDRELDENLLNKLFSAFGDVNKVTLIRDKETNLSKCYGFISMDSAVEAQRAIDELNGKEIAGRKIVVKEATNKNNSDGNQQRSRENDMGNFEDDDYEKKRTRRPKGENIPVNVIDQAVYNTESEGEFIRIKFNKD